MQIYEEYRRWLSQELEDPALARELQAIEGKDVIGQLRVGDVIESIKIENEA